MCPVGWYRHVGHSGDAKRGTQPKEWPLSAILLKHRRKWALGEFKLWCRPWLCPLQAPWAGQSTLLSLNFLCKLSSVVCSNISLNVAVEAFCRHDKHLPFCQQRSVQQSYDFTSSHIWLWELDHKEGWASKSDAFELRCWRRLLRVPWTARRSDQSIIKEINPEYSF